MHFAISQRPTRGSISSYNIAGLISEVSEEVATQIAKNCRRQQPHSHLRSPPRGTPSNILIYLILTETSHWPTFLSLHVYLHSSLYSGLQKTHLFCTALRFGRSRSFRIMEGRWFWYQSKARIRLPISRSLWLWSSLAPFLRYGDLFAKNCLFLLHFCYPSLIRRPRSLCSLWNFAAKLTTRKLQSHRAILQWRPHDRSWSRFGLLAWYHHVSDRWSDA